MRNGCIMNFVAPVKFKDLHSHSWSVQKPDKELAVMNMVYLVTYASRMPFHTEKIHCVFSFKDTS
jgi:hypothetical protein